MSVFGVCVITILIHKQHLIFLHKYFHFLALDMVFWYIRIIKHSGGAPGIFIIYRWFKNGRKYDSRFQHHRALVTIVTLDREILLIFPSRRVCLETPHTHSWLFSAFGDIRSIKTGNIVESCIEKVNFIRARYLTFYQPLGPQVSRFKPSPLNTAAHFLIANRNYAWNFYCEGCRAI